MYNEYGRQVECKIALNTKNKSDAKSKAKIVVREIEDIKDGTLQRFQFEKYFAFKNNEGTSKLVDLSLSHIIPQYLAYKESKVRSETVKRDKCSLNQLCEFVGYSKPVAELDCFHIEGNKGLIKHLQEKGYISWQEGKARTMQIVDEITGGVPIMGSVAAGGLIETYSDVNENLDLSEVLQKNSWNCLSLFVKY